MTGGSRGFPSDVRVAWAPRTDGMPRRDAAADLLGGLLPGAVVVRRCARCGSTAHGRPLVVGGRHVVSVSYTDRWVVAAVAPSSSASTIGVDAEDDDGRIDLARVLPAPSDLHAWTRVEATLKADGRGLALDPAAVTVEEVPGGFLSQVERTVYRGWDAPAPPGVVASVVLRQA